MAQQHLTMVFSSFRQALTKKVDAALKTKCPLFRPEVKFPPSYSELKNDVLVPKLFALKYGHNSILLNQHGVYEARLLQRGSYMVAGVHHSIVVGDTLADKIQSLANAHHADAFIKRATSEDGFHQA